MKITDPQSAAVPRFLAPLAGLLNSPRDLPFVWLTFQCLGVVVAGVALFFVAPPWRWLVGAGWLLMLGLLLDRFTLMLHCTSHRLLFKKRYAVLNHVIPRVVGPFFGQTPGSYFLHHLGMHHREGNLEPDLSSTMRYRRDRVDHFLRYLSRFLLIGVPELAVYFYRRRQWKNMRRLLVGEVGFGLVVALLFAWQPLPTTVVFLLPVLAMRTLMMMGNWAQHAFVVAATPENPYHSSITCLNTRYNRRCFNDGYHVLHHVKPACHWLDHPREFELALAEYGRHDALVFDGLDFFEVWSALMLRRWSHLAEHVVEVEGAPRRTREQVIELLKERVLPVPSALAEAPAVPSTEIASA
jgi:fatty acid desaturase